MNAAGRRRLVHSVRDVLAAVKIIPKHGGGFCDISESVRASASHSVVADPKLGRATRHVLRYAHIGCRRANMDDLGFVRSRRTSISILLLQPDSLGRCDGAAANMLVERRYSKVRLEC